MSHRQELNLNKLVSVLKHCIAFASHSTIFPVLKLNEIKEIYTFERN